MKYALLVHVNKEAVDQFKDANAKVAAKAAWYGLWRSPAGCGHLRRRGRSGVVAADGHYGIGPKRKTPGA